MVVLCAVPSRLPAPTSLDGTGFIFPSTGDPQEGQVQKMEHYTSGGKCREERIRNQSLFPVPPALCPCCSPPPPARPLWWRWRIYSDGTSCHCCADTTAAGQAAAGSRGNFGCGSRCAELPQWHLHPRELVGVTVPEKPWLGGDSVLSATRVVLVQWLQGMVP